MYCKLLDFRMTRKSRANALSVEERRPFRPAPKRLFGKFGPIDGPKKTPKRGCGVVQDIARVCLEEECAQKLLLWDYSYIPTYKCTKKLS